MGSGERGAAIIVKERKAGEGGGWGTNPLHVHFNHPIPASCSGSSWMGTWRRPAGPFFNGAACVGLSTLPPCGCKIWTRPWRPSPPRCGKPRFSLCSTHVHLGVFASFYFASRLSFRLFGFQHFCLAVFLCWCLFIFLSFCSGQPEGHQRPP